MKSKIKLAEYAHVVQREEKGRDVMEFRKILEQQRIEAKGVEKEVVRVTQTNEKLFE